MSRLEVQHLSVRAGQTELVHDVSLAIAEGQPLTLLGETGSGKSLLAQAIMGTLPTGLDATGRVVIAGDSTNASAAADRRHLWGRSLAHLPQEPWVALDPTMRALPQVSEGYARVRGVEGSAARARELALADLTALTLRDAGRKYPFMLSGGMAQRVAFAAARAGGASVLIADEPTKGLDAALSSDIVAILKGALERGGTLLTITHDVSMARALGGQVAVMLNGALVEQGSAADVLTSPRHEYTIRLLAAEPAAWPVRHSITNGSPVLTGRGLSKHFGTERLFGNIDLEIRSSERLAITGPSGSGKTTLGNTLLGLVSPDAGTVTRAADIAPWRFQKLYQDPVAAFPPRLTIRLALEDLVARHRLAWERVESLMQRLRLANDLLDRRPDQVSGGELQRFSLVRVLLLDPVLIFADEPTSRLDPITQQETIDLLVETTAQQQCALLLVTHDQAIAANVAGHSLTL